MKIIKYFLVLFICLFSVQSFAKSNVLEKYSYKVTNKFVYYFQDYLSKETLDFIIAHPHLTSGIIAGLSIGVGYNAYVFVPHILKSLPFLLKVDSFLNDQSTMIDINKLNEIEKLSQLDFEYFEDVEEIDIESFSY